MEDIMFSVAWQDDGCWHKSNYWAYDDGTYSVDNYADGDHETVEESDLPTFPEVEASWRAYSQEVALTGADPLGEFIVNTSHRVRERWQFRFNRSISHPVMLLARHAGRSYLWHELPAHVSQYLNLQGNAMLRDFADWPAFVEVLPEIKPMRWTTITIEHQKPRSSAVVSRMLKHLARRHLKQAA